MYAQSNRLFLQSAVLHNQNVKIIILTSLRNLTCFVESQDLSDI